jgi:flagellar basal-body rod modification protein FlgD
MSLITQTNKISPQAATNQNVAQTNGLLPTGPIATPAASGSSTGGNGLTTTNAGVQSEFNTFLTLLTTQLQNQDPTSPLDTNQFTSQLVQFSQLEQQLDTNANLQTLISGQTTSTVGTAIGYIGHTVEASGGHFVLDGTSSDPLSYNLSSAAASTTINILNANGQTVAQIPGTSTAGENDVSYNGTSPGQPTLPPGQYSFTVTAVDSSGNAIPSTVFTSGVVTGVDNSNGTVNLSIGKLVIPASSVIQVTA